MMVRIALCLAVLVPASAAQAQQGGEVFVPRLYDVSGVAADDTLNIRQSPSGSAPVLGVLAPDTGGIEVTAVNETGTWGRIGLGETDGWVSLRYLAERAFPAGDIPDGMRCVGNEPFWALRFSGGKARFATPTGHWDQPVAAASTRVPPGNQTFGFVTQEPATNLSGGVSGVIRAGQCSDGMSDRSYGWSVVLMHRQDGALTLEDGCCTLDQR